MTPYEVMTAAMEALAREGQTPRGFAAVGELLRELSKEPSLLSHQRMRELHGSAASAATIARGDGGEILMLARFPHEAPTPIHNHNSWGVICIVRGRDRHTAWTRDGDGSVVRGEDRVLDEGDVFWFGPPPDDIHSQQGIGDAAWELVFFGHDPDASPRTYYDTKQ
jgi:predicted metal-dependent enzyme (double-stranded beta helix superfamily)